MKHRILESIFSNWANLVIVIFLSFFVSPIVVHSLGTEMFGVWSLMVSITGYFTVLDFGVNTAIVRYISSKSAQKDYAGARSIYSTSFAIFFIIAAGVLIFSAIFGLFFQGLFRLQHVPINYLYMVILICAVDFASGLLSSVFLGSLVALQEFPFINSTSISLNIVRSLAIVIFMRRGYGILTLALLQFISNFAKSACYYILIKLRYAYLSVKRNSIDVSTVHLIYNYSIYSFVIAVALKLLFYTDSVVIGSLIAVSEVTYYVIPSTLLDYLEKFIWSIIAVLIPIISANEATGKNENNSHLYITGTRYILLASTPVVISLYFFGEDFLRLWMGPLIAERSKRVLQLLLIGYGIALPQLIAHGILKGIEKHRVLAYILAVEAVANLIMSIMLARKMGIEGVALGTMVPLILATIMIILYTCRQLRVGVFDYVSKAYTLPTIAGLASSGVALMLVSPTKNYLSLILKGCVVFITFQMIALPFSLQRDHRKNILLKAGSIVAYMRKLALYKYIL